MGMVPWTTCERARALVPERTWGMRSARRYAALLLRTKQLLSTYNDDRSSTIFSSVNVIVLILNYSVIRLIIGSDTIPMIENKLNLSYLPAHTMANQPLPVGAMLGSRGTREFGEVGERLGRPKTEARAPVNETLVALAKVDPHMAWDEWKKNTLARRAKAYRDL